MLPKLLLLLIVAVPLCAQITVGGAAIDVLITGEHSASPMDTALRVLHGSMASPAMSRRPGVYWQRVDGSNNVNGDRYFSIYGRKSGGTGGVETFSVESRSTAPGAGELPGMAGIASRMVSENVGNSDFAFWGVTSCFTTGSDCTGAEFNVVNDTFTNARSDYGSPGHRLTGLILASAGTAKTTAATVIDSQNGQTSAWQRGVDIRPNGVAAGGYGLLLPNNVRIGGRTTAHADFPMLWAAEAQTRLNAQTSAGLTGCVNGANCVPLRSGLRYSLVTSSSPISNTTMATGFDRAYTIPAGEIDVAGAVVRVRMAGTYSTVGNPGLALGLRIGGVTCAGEFLGTAYNAAGFKWVMDAECVVRQPGAWATLQRGHAMISMQGGGSVPGALSGAFNINTQAAVGVRGVAAWHTAALGNTITLDSMTVWIEYPQTVGN